MFKVVRRKTNEEWLEQVHSLVGDDYTFKDSYVTGNVELEVTHNVCGSSYKVTPNNFLAGRRCKKCQIKITGGRRKRTHEEFVALVSDLVGDEYSVMSEYTGHHKKVYMRHNTCGHSYYVTASDFIKGRRCKTCRINVYKKTQEQWESEVSLLAGNDFEFLEPYKGDNTKIAYRHICGHTHSMTPNNFLNGTRCPNCLESTGESHVRRWLEENNIEYVFQATFPNLKYKKYLSYDFYIPELKIVIEYQGQQHYRPISYFGGEQVYEKQKKKDRIKRSYAKDNGYTLVEIPYTYSTYEQVKEMLNNTVKK